MKYSFVIMKQDRPIGVMMRECGRKFHGVVQVDAMEHNFSSVPVFTHGARSYTCTDGEGKPILYQLHNIRVIPQ